MYQSKVLIISGEREVSKVLRHFLERKGFKAMAVSAISEALKEYSEVQFDLVIADVRINESQGILALSKLSKVFTNIPVLLLSYFNEIKTAAQFIKKGVFGYALHPIVTEEVWLCVNEALGEDKIVRAPLKRMSAPLSFFTKEENPLAAKKTYRFTNSIPSQNVKQLTQVFAPLALNVMLIGEAGTGKSSLARTIHNHSKKANAAFVKINCNVLSDDKEWESFLEITRQNKQGGTLFFNTISALSFTNQKRLWNFLEEENQPNEIGEKPFRILVAEEKHLITALNSMRFHEELYYTLNQADIYLPKLSADVNGLLLHVDVFIKEANHRFNTAVVGINAPARNLLKVYLWPGNLRELRMVIYRAVLSCSEGKIDLVDLPFEMVNQPNELFPPTELEIPSLKEVAELAEANVILKVLKQTGNNKTKTASVLGIDRKTLYNKMAAYQLLD